MNLTQTQANAKQALLTNQQEQMLALYQNAKQDEREAIMKQIEAFLPAISEEAKEFWQEFKAKLESLDKQSEILFSLGQTVMTQGAKQALLKSGENPSKFLALHQSGNWGLICDSDKKENDFSVKEGFRILSAYKTSKGEKIWIITEADRSSTCLLLPEEY